MEFFGGVAATPPFSDLVDALWCVTEVLKNCGKRHNYDLGEDQIFWLVHGNPRYELIPAESGAEI